MERIMCELSKLESAGNKSSSVIYYVRVMYSMCVITVNKATAGQYIRDTLFSRHSVTTDTELLEVMLRYIRKFGSHFGTKFAKIPVSDGILTQVLDNDSDSELYSKITGCIRTAFLARTTQDPQMSAPKDLSATSAPKDLSAMLLRVYPLIWIALCDKWGVVLPYRQSIIDSITYEFLSMSAPVTVMQLAYIVTLGSV